MNAKQRTRHYVYVKGGKPYGSFNSMQMLIIIVFISLVTLISFFLPIIFATLPLNGA